MSLTSALNKQEFPKVEDIITNIKEAKESGNFAKVITNDDKEYYFLASDVMKIDANPENYIVKHSAKHNCQFIMATTGGTFSKF